MLLRESFATGPADTEPRRRAAFAEMWGMPRNAQTQSNPVWFPPGKIISPSRPVASSTLFQHASVPGLSTIDTLGLLTSVGDLSSLDYWSLDEIMSGTLSFG